MIGQHGICVSNERRSRLNLSIVAIRHAIILASRFSTQMSRVCMYNKHNQLRHNSVSRRYVKKTRDFVYNLYRRTPLATEIRQ